ncbi:MAG: RNA polymerase sigma-70 factor [Balneolaceae bacterium]
MEQDWIKRIRNGDVKAFEAMFLSYYDPLCRFANQYLKSLDKSESLVQDVFVRIWEIKADWLPAGSIRSYLYKSVKNKALDYIKHQKVEQRYADEVAGYCLDYSKSPEEILEERDFIMAVQKAIERLPQKSRRVYKLHRQEGLKYREIAERLGVSPKTVESRMSKALELLRQQFTSHLS